METVREYFTGKSIFITGVTGFIGKALVEKLLRSCPEVGNIFCLIRPKRGRNGKERLNDLFQDELFDQLTSERPEIIEKVIAIAGDVGEENLGICQSDREMLKGSVHIVFHSAATIKFDEPLRSAVNINILGLKRLIHLCKDFVNLEVFEHVSTAYVVCESNCITEENVYPVATSVNTLLQIVSDMNDEILNRSTKRIIGNKVNTYLFTKHLAEELLCTEACDLPTCIIRPSLVTAVWKDPIPFAKGILRTLYLDTSIAVDIVPVDIVVNGMIAAAWYTATHKNGHKAKIYQITTSSTNPVTWADMEHSIRSVTDRFPMEGGIRRPFGHIRKNRIVHKFWVVVSHWIPAYFIDCALKLVGQTPFMVRIYNKMYKTLDTLSYFMGRQWFWSHTNLDHLSQVMTSEDKKVFYIDTREIEWNEYTENYYLGTKVFLMKESLANVPAAKAHLKRLRNARYCFNTVILLIAARLLVTKSSLMQSSWSYISRLYSLSSWLR